MNERRRQKKQADEEKLKKETAESEYKSMERKLVLLHAEAEQKENAVKDAETKLADVTNQAEEASEKFRELKDNEVTEDERIEQLEADVKAAGDRLAEYQNKLTESERKNVMIRADIDKVTRKAEAQEQRAEILQSGIDKAADKIAHLETTETNASEEEERNSLEIGMKETEICDYEVRRDTALRGINVLNAAIKEVEKEIETLTNKNNGIQDEINKMVEGDFSGEDED